VRYQVDLGPGGGHHQPRPPGVNRRAAPRILPFPQNQGGANTVWIGQLTVCLPV